MTATPPGALPRIVATGIVPVVRARSSEEAMAVIEVVRVGRARPATVGESVSAGSSALRAGADLAGVRPIRAGDPAAVSEKRRPDLPAVGSRRARAPARGAELFLKESP